MMSVGCTAANESGSTWRGAGQRSRLGERGAARAHPLLKRSRNYDVVRGDRK